MPLLRRSLSPARVNTPAACCVLAVAAPIAAAVAWRLPCVPRPACCCEWRWDVRGSTNECLLDVTLSGKKLAASVSAPSIPLSASLSTLLVPNGRMLAACHQPTRQCTCGIRSAIRPDLGSYSTCQPLCCCLPLVTFVCGCCVCHCSRYRARIRTGVSHSTVFPFAWVH